MPQRTKYPSTAYLKLSPSGLPLAGALAGANVVITEKMDGENTTIAQGYTHARSVDSRHHPSRSWLKSWHQQIAWQIPEGLRICGENLYAKHSIYYPDLESYFYGFSAWRGTTCLPWAETLGIFESLGIQPVPVLFEGKLSDLVCAQVVQGLDLSRQEGFVVRVAGGFELEQFPEKVQKWVRHGHVQTDQHWASQAVVPNGLNYPA
jgi:hypothetical protein